MPIHTFDALMEDIQGLKVLMINFSQVSSVAVLGSKGTQYRGVPSPSIFEEKVKLELVVGPNQLEQIYQSLDTYNNAGLAYVVTEVKEFKSFSQNPDL
ncbi:hypothetical protein [Litoribacter populi]|uniref:hypothetical protein n=1 Tax=Litoribacter populi TaxID=2598460 RepID=UPI00117F62FE|nr:hypothetical protein [Litoribacter populi]